MTHQERSTKTTNAARSAAHFALRTRINRNETLLNQGKIQASVRNPPAKAEDPCSIRARHWCTRVKSARKIKGQCSFRAQKSRCSRAPVHKIA